MAIGIKGPRHESGTHYRQSPAMWRAPLHSRPAHPSTGVLELPVAGATAEEILKDCPYLDREDIFATRNTPFTRSITPSSSRPDCASWWKPSFRPHWITAQGKAAEHVADLGMARASDREIWDSARQTGAVIVTKDEDSAILHVIHGNGPTVFGCAWRTIDAKRYSTVLPSGGYRS